MASASGQRAARLLSQRIRLQPAGLGPAFLPPRTPLSTSPARLSRGFLGLGKMRGQYQTIRAAELAFKQCKTAAKYGITDEDRKKGSLKQTEDGEDLGVPQGPWHESLNLLPTFSTWSQVTMLHLYLLYARFRCLDAETAKAYQQQILDQFFFESEALMEIQHGMYSAALRQRYLKDLFIQWRGLIFAYDEGIVKGDAELASAVWRNVFKGSEEVDPVALAGVVAWMRMTLRHLEQMSDEEIMLGKNLFSRPLEEVLPGVKKDLEVQAKMRTKRTPANSGDAPTQASAAASG